MKLIIIALVLVMVGCAESRPKRDPAALVNAWVGKTGSELVAAWGAPTKTFKAANGNTMYEFKEGGNYNSYFNGAVVDEQYCTFRYNVDKNDKIIGAGFTGNTCD